MTHTPHQCRSPRDPYRTGRARFRITAAIRTPTRPVRYINANGARTVVRTTPVGYQPTRNVCPVCTPSIERR